MATRLTWIGICAIVLALDRYMATVRQSGTPHVRIMMPQRLHYYFVSLLACICLAAVGCVERTLQLRSEPSGALVYLNGKEVARTPADVPLEWYGKYDIAVRKEGYETLKTERWVVAPWWQWPPIDLVAEILPVRLTDRQTLQFQLEPAAAGDEAILERAEALRSQVINETGE